MTYESNMELTGSEPAPAPVADPAPSPEVTPKVDPPADPTPEVTPKVDEPILYETPDGRKVDAETLQKEWKENFLPEFTRKSQRLAEIDREKDLNSPDKDVPAWKKPDYVPQNYAEVIELAKKEALNEIQSTYQAEQDRIKSVHDAVDAEITELKKTDPTLDENALFQHANKYGFQSLKSAHSNMTDMKKSALDAEQRTVKNLKTREADPISTAPGGELPENTGYDPKEMSQFDSATEYLAHLKGKK
jgi:hypothetical protein